MDNVLKCDDRYRPDETRNCTSSMECPEWIVGPWSECSELCGEGVKNRSVTCSLNYSNDSRHDQYCDNLPYRPERYVSYKGLIEFLNHKKLIANAV